MRSKKRVIYLFGLLVLLLACKKNDMPKAPVLEIVSPANNTEVFQGPGYGTSIVVNANDPDGLVRKVEVKIDNNLIGQASVSPYIFGWDNIAAVGNHTLTATATDNDGLSTSVSITIKVKTEAPAVSTLPVSFVGTTFAICASYLASRGVPEVSLRGICWNKTGSPTIADSINIVQNDTGTFTSPLSGLQLGTTYYVRAFAQNRDGVVYGNQVNFTTATAYTTGSGSFTDPRDLQTYQWVKIGSQIWMAENLRYNYGSYYYPNANETSYGRLYFTPSTSIAPPGWHLPSKSEWEELINFVGGTDDAGGILKEAGNAHWISPNVGASDLTNFHPLPAGYIATKYGTSPQQLGTESLHWSADGYIMSISSYDRGAGISQGSNDITWDLLSVRCIKD